MYKKIAILGSTGSIGTQALEVARNLGLSVVAISANSNIELLERQIVEFKPKLVAVRDKILADALRERVQEYNLSVKICYGLDGMNEVAEFEESEMLLTSVVGSVGLIPTIKAIRKGKAIALANKETLVTAGKLVMEEAKKFNVPILPVDSEHSAVFACILGNSHKDIEKIILTASGGPFRGKKAEELNGVTRAQALKHPNWSMGAKITIDSATMMNKGLEVIEAKWLFDVGIDMIDVVVHPQSIIHSMVEYKDGSIMAQLGSPDMKIPIQYAFTYPQRVENDFRKLDIIKVGNLTFEEPDLNTFKCLKLAYDAINEGGTMPVVLNAANEIAVSMFLEDKVGFMDIADIVERQMLRHSKISNPSIEEIVEVDLKTRALVLN